MLASESGLRADPLLTWRSLAPWPSAAGINGVTFANGTFVAVGFDTILTSSDGRAWIQEQPGNIGRLNAVCHGQGLFVAVGYETIVTSTDGHRWLDQSAGILYYLSDVSYGNGVFVAVGFGGAILTSSNGMAWAEQSAGPIANLYGIEFVDGAFFAVGYNGVLSSPDGIHWSMRHAGTVLRDVAHGGGTLVAVGNSHGSTNIVRRSVDGGATWTPVPAGTDACELYGVAYGAGQFVAVSLEGGILSSVDGERWSRTSGVDSPWLMTSVAFGNGAFVAAGGSVSPSLWISSDAWAWRRVDQSASYAGIASGNNLHVAVGVGSNLFSSVDGAVWTPRSLGRYRALEDVAFANGVFVVVGLSGTILRSTDGVSWVEQTGASSSDLFSVVHGQTQFVAVGRSGLVGRSPEGERWAMAQAPVRDDLVDVAWTGEHFIAVSGQGEAVGSSDGINWSAWRVGGAANSQTNAIRVEAVTHGIGRDVFVGSQLEIYEDIVLSKAAVWTSPARSAWTVTLFEGLSGLADVTFAHGALVAVGERGSVLVSTNGLDWDRVEPVTSRALRAVTYSSGRFIAVGVLNSIVQSGFYGPPVLVAMTLKSSGFELKVGGGPGRECRLQASDTLASPDWQDLQSFRTSESIFEFTDPDAGRFPHRFYRVVSP